MNKNKKNVSNKKPKIVSKIVVRNPRKMQVPRSMRMINPYALGLRNPFDPRVEGVKLPNEFKTPTITQIIRGYNTMNFTTGSTESGYIFLPSPVVSFCNKNNFGLSSTDMGIYAGAGSWKSAAFPSILTARFSSWRLVCGGIRIRSVANMSQPAAVITVGTAPVVNAGPGPNFLEGLPSARIASNEDSRLIQTITGLSSSAPVSRHGSILTGLPGVQRMTTHDLISDAIVVPFRPADPRAFDFRAAPAVQQYGIGIATGDNIYYDTTTGLPIQALTDETSHYSAEGFSAILIDMVGSAVNILPLIEVEYIYHIEGIPSLNLTSNNGSFTSSSSPGTYGIATHLKDVISANSDTLIRVVSGAVGTMFKKAVDPAVYLGLQY